jgi:FkbM family methyltransferase
MATIIDIGANVGSFTKAWMNKYPNCDFLCVEANPDLIPVLEGLFHGEERVTIINKLVSDKDGEMIDFWINDNHTLSTASKRWIEKSRFNHTNYEKKIQVETVTLDTLIKTYGSPNLTKIDVEGYELEVLKGLSKYSGEIIFEWTEELFYKTVECAKQLILLGYSKFGYTMRDYYTALPDEYKAFHEMDLFHKINLIGDTNWGNIYAK